MTVPAALQARVDADLTALYAAGARPTAQPLQIAPGHTARRASAADAVAMVARITAGLFLVMAVACTTGMPGSRPADPTSTSPAATTGTVPTAGVLAGSVR